MTLEEVKPSFLDLPEDEQWSHIRQLRKDRRNQADSNKVARKVSKATGNRVTKKATMTGKALEKSVGDLSKDQLLKTIAALKKKHGLK